MIESGKVVHVRVGDKYVRQPHQLARRQHGDVAEIEQHCPPLVAKIDVQARVAKRIVDEARFEQRVHENVRARSQRFCCDRQLANALAGSSRMSVSGSSRRARIARRAASRSTSAAFQSWFAEQIGAPISITISDRRGSHSPARSSERVPMSATGMIGAPVCAATMNAPSLKG